MSDAGARPPTHGSQDRSEHAPTAGAHETAGGPGQPTHDLSRLREDYDRDRLDEETLAADPLAELRRWLDTAIEAGLTDPAAMVLATVAPDGAPSARTVLCKGLDEQGVAFYTNLESRKARELAAHPYAACVFVWTPLHRQVTLRGRVEALPDVDADAYFAARPRESRLAAWASPQSQPVADRGELDELLAATTARFEGRDVPRPESWGGFRVVPDEVELWQGRLARLHDRVRYVRADEGWTRQRLAP